MCTRRNVFLALREHFTWGRRSSDDPASSCSKTAGNPASISVPAVWHFGRQHLCTRPTTKNNRTDPRWRGVDGPTLLKPAKSGLQHSRLRTRWGLLAIIAMKNEHANLPELHMCPRRCYAIDAAWLSRREHGCHVVLPWRKCPQTSVGNHSVRLAPVSLAAKRV